MGLLNYELCNNTQYLNYGIRTKLGESFKAGVSIKCSMNPEMKVDDKHNEVLKHTDVDDHVTVHPNKIVCLPMSSTRTSSMANHSLVVVEGPSIIS